jgi:hypothetical protein
MTGDDAIYSLNDTIMYGRLPSDWIKDVHLVFDNAEQYNAEEDAVFKLALRVRSSFEHAANVFLSSTFPPLQQLLADLASDISKEIWQDLPSWLLECRIILKQLLFHPCAWPFLRWAFQSLIVNSRQIDYIPAS